MEGVLAFTLTGPRKGGRGPISSGEEKKEKQAETVFRF